MEDRYNHAPNDSPRSGGTKRTTPLIWAAVVVVIVVIAIWFAIKT
jgi:hypothetical protein